MDGNMTSLSLWTSLTTLLLLLPGRPPRLEFYSIASEQPKRIEGVPEWRDSVLVRNDTLIVRHLRERRFYTRLDASLRTQGDTLEVRVVETAGKQGQEGGVPGGGREVAYEVRIGSLNPGMYSLVLLDEGFSHSLTKPFILRRTFRVPVRCAANEPCKQRHRMDP
jgi:hypothetical protein